jgi:hypothetical protein
MVIRDQLHDKLILQAISIKIIHKEIGWHHFTMLMTVRSTDRFISGARLG